MTATKKANKKPAAKKPAKQKFKSNVVAFKLPRPNLGAQFSGSSAPAAKFPARVQQLIDRDEIQQIVYSYCRAADRNDEHLLRSVFHAEATLDLGPGLFQGTSTDYIGWFSNVMQQVKSSQHFVGNCRVEVKGDAAYAESYFMIHHRLDKPTGREDLFLSGRWLDRLERRPTGTAGVWKIVHRKQLMDWVRTEPVADIFYHFNPDSLWGHRNKTDLSYHMENFPGTNGGGKMPAYLGRRYEGKSVKF
jgi:hypothetical protein